MAQLFYRIARWFGMHTWWDAGDGYAWSVAAEIPPSRIKRALLETSARVALEASS